MLRISEGTENVTFVVVVAKLTKQFGFGCVLGNKWLYMWENLMFHKTRQ